MADDQGRRSEPASARQLREARRVGRIARSRDLGAWSTLAGALAMIWVGRDLWVGQMHSLAGLGVGQVATLVRADTFDIVPTLLAWAKSVLLLALPVPLACLVVATLVHGTFNRWLFAPAAALPNFDRLNPAANLKRMYSLHNWMELAKSAAKTVLLGAGLWLTIVWALPSLVQVPMWRSLSLAGVIERILSGFLCCSLAGLGLITLFNVWYQRFSYLRDSRVTPEEKKRDRRQDEGDPAQRAKRRQLLLELVRESPLERCVHASLVVCSSAQSTAVAIYWEPDSTEVPWLLNKGQNLVGQAIIQVARDNQISLLEDSELCNRIYRQTGIDADLGLALATELARYR